jgi:hypothetical protein
VEAADAAEELATVQQRVTALTEERDALRLEVARLLLLIKELEERAACR